jgi:hypothetical protein
MTAGRGYFAVIPRTGRRRQSTATTLLADHFAALGEEVFGSREPSGSEIGPLPAPFGRFQRIHPRLPDRRRRNHHPETDIAPALAEKPPRAG